MILDYTELYDALGEASFGAWGEALRMQVDAVLKNAKHGNLPKWKQTIDALPAFECEECSWQDELRFTGRFVKAGAVAEEQAEVCLKELLPWRKGPLRINEIFIDTEWRSDWKWKRLVGHISPLAGRRVLDIGCGNGYHLWRMLGAGAKLALGVDPLWLYVMQFWATKHFAPASSPAWVLPLGVDELPNLLPEFDTVFSMGVLYHRMSPFEHLLKLQNLLRAGGELVLETLVIDAGRGEVLVPDGRYAKMRNVWFIPSVSEMVAWLQRVGWKNVRCVDVTPTSCEEQRSTEWMQFESLADFLDPEDASKTIEGYPAPVRAVFIAEKLP